MRRIYFGWLVTIFFFSGACAPDLPEDVSVALEKLPDVDYNLHVKPILSDKCFACHGPDKAKQKAGLRLDVADIAYGNLPENPGKVAIKPGNLRQSEVVHRILSNDPEYVMPEPSSHLTLSTEEKAILIKWIDEGAVYKPHWSLVKPELPVVPEADEGLQTNNAIDHFVLRKLKKENLMPAKEAEKELLLRRVSLDLTGLPPTLEEIESFVNDPSSDAYEKQVDRLLSSPHYGEKILLDLEAFDLISRTGNEASFSRTAELKNYSGTNFRIRIDRLIRVLTPNEAFAELGVNSAFDINSVAYQSTNSLTNIGSADWNKRSGLLSIWMLGMFKPSPEMTIVLPFNKGDEQAIGPVVNDDYFGKVPQDRLKVGDGIIYFKGDGKYRSKIGLTPLRAKNLIGSYDGASNTLTILKFNKPDNTVDYVNSKWEMQDQPFRGDVINSYNDGPAEPGAKPMGPFYELESSSPALELKKGESLVHRQTTFHFQGNEKSLDRLALEVFGVSVIEINEVFK